MMKTIVTKYIALRPAHLLLGVCLLLAACKGADKAAGDDEDAKVESQTPVTVTTVDQSPMADYIDLSATSSFMQKNFVKANANGYIEKVNTQLGQLVGVGQLLFTIKTKEAQSIGNSINILDTTFKFSGINRIKASGHGYVTAMSHQLGDYVQDGEALATISDASSFAFLMQVPYEYRSNIKINQVVSLTMPDGEKLDARVVSNMPAVDTLAQTQGFILKVNASHPIPENLIARARLVKTLKENTFSLPKQAILANETQTNFWVMKMINTTTAIKVPVTKGIEMGDRVEILTPKFSNADKIVATGNYGLSDTAKVKIVQP